MGREEGWGEVPSLWEEGVGKERGDGRRGGQRGGDDLLLSIPMEDSSGEGVLSMRQ